MPYFRLKLCVVLLGVCWCLILVYVMSSLKWHPGDINAAQLLARQAKAEDIPAPRVAKSLVALNEVIDAARGNSSNGRVANVSRLEAPVTPLTTGNNTHKSAVNVVISGNEETLLGLITTINSVLSNTHSDVHFYVTLPKIIIPDFRKWIYQTKLQKLSYTLRPHAPEMPKGKPQFAKLYLLQIFPELLGKAVYLDSDVIVQGDIEEFSNIQLDGTGVGAFPEECNAVSKRFNQAKPRYSTHINLQHPKLKGTKIKPMTCTFNTDVFVVDVNKWKEANVTLQLKEWISSHSQSSPINGPEPEADEAEAAMLIVLYNLTKPLPQLWHVGDLGVTAGVGYSKEFITKAKLLHWNGHFKPWGRRSAFAEVWMKYYLPDPDKKYKPMKFK